MLSGLPFDAPRVEHLFPGIRDEASRTTRKARVLPLRHQQTKAAVAHTAGRAGWVGCNIALNRILVEAWLNIEIRKDIRNRVTVEEAWPRFIGRPGHVIMG